MELFKVDTIEEAKEKLKEALLGFGEGFFKKETVKSAQSAGRVLAGDILSEIDVPGFNRSTVDGYALKSSDTRGASEAVPVFLKTAGEVKMGEKPDFTIKSGLCAYVPTGGMLPEGADSVAMIEYCEKFGESSVAVNETLSPGRNTVLKGEDIRRGDIFLKKGRVITPRDMGAMASAGVGSTEVFSPIKIGVISTGDELTDPSAQLECGKIYDINTYSLISLAASRGFEPVYKAVVPDEREEIVKAVGQAMESCEVVVLSGGSSQGEKDMTADIIDSLCNPGVFTHGLAIKPGKPTILGYDGEKKRILAGLPGHPVAAMMVFELVICSVFDELTGRSPIPCVFAEMAENYGCDQGKANCIPLILEEGARGYKALPIPGKSSLMRTLTRADGYTLTDRNKEGLNRGEIVKVHLFR
ncbi:MAG: molybdopterin molybdenumtransferase MoeA [Eubacteriaceae bacterium]|jgi:molybdopterin molybdotransferase|nr:molybdopterin molybdenumtransferase MoeA [Eubacteriaceae bacterium]